MGPSIYDVHTEEVVGGQVEVNACGQDKGSAPSGRLHRKLEPTDVILSSSHAKKLAFFGQEFRL